ncbi:MAG: class I SAM-dependent methyltransferase [Bacillota bacterium]
MLLDLVHRSRRPEPWSEGENIPWNDPDFSRRMLAEHLSQEHDLASRRSGIIESQVDWIHEAMLGARPGHVVDLGCGPGLYTAQLARLGHTCTGIDWSPASIDYARVVAHQEGLSPTYLLEDLRNAPLPPNQDLIMLLYGEFNVFKPADVAQILSQAYQALKPGGRLLLEAHTVNGIKADSEERGWWALPNGLFSDRPHLGLEESFWDETAQVKTVRYYIIDAETAETTRYAASYQAYSHEAYAAALTAAGFTEVAFRESLSEAYPQDGLQVITAVRPA